MAEHEPAAGLTDVPAGEAVRANRAWWDSDAEAYQAEHGRFLAGVPDGPPVHPALLPPRLVWCPEGWDEAEVRLLAPPGGLVGRRVLEVGAGAAQGSRWVAAEGGLPVALDLSGRMLALREPPRGPEHDHARAAAAVPAVQADACRLPLADRSVDLAFSAYGALPFVADAGAVLREVARVVRPGGRWVHSTSHPFRWALPDDPGWDGLRVGMSYFDRRPYVERDDSGRVRYAEYHRTVGDWVRLVRGAGLVLEDLLEPEWPEHHDRTWGGWSPLRGQYVPGTLVVVCTVP